MYRNLTNRGVAQLVEQRSPKPRVVSSSLATPATLVLMIMAFAIFLIKMLYFN